MTNSFILTDEQIHEIEANKEERAKEQVAVACADMNRLTKKEKEFTDQLMQKLGENIRVEKHAQLEMEIEQAKRQAEQKVREEAAKADPSRSPLHSAYQSLMKGLFK